MMLAEIFLASNVSNIQVCGWVYYRFPLFFLAGCCDNAPESNIKGEKKGPKTDYLLDASKFVL